jgi:hypothetical protein
MAFADIYNMQERLNRIDPRIIRIDFDFDKQRHNVIAWDAKEHDEYIAFTVPLGELDARVEKELYRIRPENYNVFDELRAFEAKREQEEDQRISEMAHGMADVLYKPLMRDALGV